MNKDQNIREELESLQSSLPVNGGVSGYSVPEGYFDQLSGKMLVMVKGFSEGNAGEDLTEDDEKGIGSFDDSLMKSDSSSRGLIGLDSVKDDALKLDPSDDQLMKSNLIKDGAMARDFFNDDARKFNSSEGEVMGDDELSPLLASVQKINPYSTPHGYFGDDELSPLLQSLRHKTTFHVPDGYFDKLIPRKFEKAKLIQMGRRWTRYVAAAVTIAAVAITAFFVYNRKDATATNANSYAWVKKNLQQVSNNDIDQFLQLTDESTTSTVSTGDVKELVKDVSDKEIQDFLNEVEADDVDEALN